MVLAVPVSTPSELYAHALAIEREAAERYAEFAQRMADEGNDQVATLFRTLAVFEAEHLETLEARTKGVDLPRIAPGEYAWLDAGAPETAAHDLVFRLLTPHQALEIALEAERRAKQFFTEVKETATDPALRALAQEMAMEEQGHIAMVQLTLERTPAGKVDWGRVFGD
ncbi:MAG TPA: ferritin family protein [Burkholderiales bacterium]|nr:ferritin family protein [Burkholderiales bacterium]